MSLTSSVRWVVISQCARIASQLVSVTVLSRLLPQQAYGMLAMAMTVTNLAFLFRDLGTSTVIIQKEELSDDLLATVHAINMITGLSIMTLLLILAVPVSLAYNVTELASMLAVLSLIFPVSALGLLDQAKIERDSGFRLLARIDAVSIGAGLISSISLALAGAGVWSLVIQMLVVVLMTNLQLRINRVSKTKFRLSATEFRSIISYGGRISIFRFLLYFEQNADSMIIGHALGPVALATYSMSSKITLFPLQNITGPITRALFPEFSRNQNSIAALRKTYIRSVNMICIIAAPVMAGVYFLRADLTAILFGPKWDGIPDVLHWLAPVGFLQAMTATTGVVFMALGRSGLLLKLGVAGCVLQVSSYFIGIHWGIQGVAECFFIANLINFIPCSVCAMKCLQAEWTDALAAIARPLGACCIMILALTWMEHANSLSLLPLVASAVVKSACAASIYFVMLTAVFKQDLSSLYAFLRPSPRI